MCTLAVHPRSLAFGAVLGLPLVLCKHGTGTPPACAHVACRASWCILTLGEKPAKTRGKEKTTHSLGNTSASVLFFLPRFFFLHWFFQNACGHCLASRMCLLSEEREFHPLPRRPLALEVTDFARLSLADLGGGLVNRRLKVSCCQCLQCGES